MKDFQGDGLLFQFEGKQIGIDQIPRESFGIYGEKNIRFWTSYLRTGELFFWKNSWYRVAINKLENFGEFQKYTFFAIPVYNVQGE